MKKSDKVNKVNEANEAIKISSAATSTGMKAEANHEYLNTLIAIRRHGLIEKDGYEIVVKLLDKAIKKATE